MTGSAVSSAPSPSSSAPPSIPAEGTFSFVDMAGFTALTEAHGDRTASDLAALFAELTRRALGPGDRLVKTIGDAVLVISSDAPAAIAMVGALFCLAAQEPGFPVLRAGMHHGTCVERAGDVFGAAVNLAARVAGCARAGEVLCTDAIAAAARVSGVATTCLGPIHLKNVLEPVALHVLHVGGARPELVGVDPVCRMRVDRRDAPGHVRHEGTDYWFCSVECVAAFAAAPHLHIASLESRVPPAARRG